MTMQTALLLCVVSVFMLALPCLSATTGPMQTSWSLCASKNYAVTIKDVLISPDPVVAGSVATFTIPAYSTQELDGGTLVVTVLFYGIKVHTEKDDICAKSACPIQGDFSFINSEVLPAYTPPGSYTLKFQVLDAAGQELSCVSVKFNIVWGSELKEVVKEAAAAFQREIGQ